MRHLIHTLHIFFISLHIPSYFFSIWARKEEGGGITNFIFTPGVELRIFQSHADWSEFPISIFTTRTSRKQIQGHISSYFHNISAYLLHIPSYYLFSIWARKEGDRGIDFKRKCPANFMLSQRLSSKFPNSLTKAYDWSEFPTEACDWSEYSKTVTM